MANRSYLYASNEVPTADRTPAERDMIGIAEWNYDIPIAFKLLLSGNPQPCNSSIWKCPEQIAIAGDYEAGFERLSDFLNRISNVDARPLASEADAFLRSEKNRRRFFVLECGEIFEMHDQPLLEQNEALIHSILNLEAEEKTTREKVSVSMPAGPSSRHGKRVVRPIDRLGLGNWSNTLYFDLNPQRKIS